MGNNQTETLQSKFARFAENNTVPHFWLTYASLLGFNSAGLLAANQISDPVMGAMAGGAGFVAGCGSFALSLVAKAPLSKKANANFIAGMVSLGAVMGGVLGATISQSNAERAAESARMERLPTADPKTPVVTTLRDRACGAQTTGEKTYVHQGNEVLVPCVP